MSLTYPELSKTDLPERKDALVPDPQEFDSSDPDGVDQAKAACRSAGGRLDLFARLARFKDE